jgi:exosortase/archaeosortase family protein
MTKNIFAEKKFIRFVVIFITVFLVCYYASLFLTGVAVPGGMYSPFVEKYFNIAAWLRTSLLIGSTFLLSIFGTETVRINEYVIRAVGGTGVRIVYACLGFGVMSFWIAYIVANIASLQKKLVWVSGGLLFLWTLNVVRISLVLVAGNKGWHFPFGWDHHTWFNIIAYLAIFAMIYFFEKSLKKNFTQ